MQVGVSKVTEKGQVTIPREIREGQGIEPGSSVVFLELDGLILLRRSDDLEDLFRSAHQKARDLGLTRAAVNKAVKEVRKETAAKHGLARRT